MDFADPVDNNLQMKENEKIDKYREQTNKQTNTPPKKQQKNPKQNKTEKKQKTTKKNLQKQKETVEHENDGHTNRYLCPGNGPQRLGKKIWRDLRRLAFTQTPEKDCQLTLV